MDALCPGIFLPHGEIGFHIDPFHTVQRDNVEFAGRFVIFDRVSGGNNDPAFRDRMCAESFVLEKLKHGRDQSFRYAVDLINEENPLLAATFFNRFIDRGDDLTHRIFRDGIFFTLIIFLHDNGKSYGTLAGVVRDGIGGKTDSAFPGNLFHDGSLADPGWSDQKNRTLADRGHEILSVRVFTSVDLYRVENFFFGFFNIHSVILSGYA